MKTSSFQKVILFAFIITAFFLSSCAGRKAVFLENQETPKSSEVASEVKLDLRAVADALWELRGSPGKAREMLNAYIAASEANPTDINLSARLSRAYYLVANYVESDPEKKDELFTKGL